MNNNDGSPIIVTGPAGSGKSHWIQEYAKEQKKQLITCPCRKDRTLREGRQKLHVLGKRREAVILWLEGADDLTPEAQAFLRRILETHSSDVQFVLECRDPGKLQEPIRSRCLIFRKTMPTRLELEDWTLRSYKGIDIETIFEYLNPDEYSYRRIKHCIFLQLQSPDLWKQVVQNRREERVAATTPTSNLVPTYQSNAYNPEAFLGPLLGNPDTLRQYGECLERGGSVWAFLSSALSSD
jgi:hypothetical protein